MKEKSINEINEIYDLELTRIIRTINKEKSRNVLLQFPEGMKPYSQVICDYIEENTKSNCFIWIGTCFGACDIPVETEKLGIDLIIQFGHSNWSYKRTDINVLKK
ncbi:MAG: diphthamide synthesis protein [Candidatus Pacearchaeota archaeon]|jgi:2-(3-amino-3-carboxypropyl)histidine synthase